MDQDTYKQCAVCGELVPQNILACPKCGRGVFETHKIASVTTKPSAMAAQTNLAKRPTSFLVNVWEKITTTFAKWFGPSDISAQTKPADSQTSILIYVFCNGFHPDGMLLNTLSIAWLMQECGDDEQMLVRMSALLRNAAKYGVSVPQVPSDSWTDIANLIPKAKVEQMHPNREMRFIIFSKKIDPKMPDAMVAVVLGANETDIVQAERLIASKVI